MDRSDFVAAERFFAAAIACDRTADAYIGLGRALAGQNRFREGFAALTEATKLAPDSAEAHYRLGRHLLGFGHPEMALPSFLRVRELAREGHADNAHLISHCLSRLRFLPPVDLNDDFVALLESEAFDDLTANSPVSLFLARRYARSDLTDAELCQALSADRLAHLFLQHCFNVDPDLETVLGRVRRFLSSQDPAVWPTDRSRWRLCIALAIGFHNGAYAVPWSDGEQADLGARLAAVRAVEDGAGDPPAAFAPTLVAIAMYQTPSLEHMRRLAGSPAPDAELQAFVARFHDEPLALAAERIEPLPTGEDAGSAEKESGATAASVTTPVRAQYESHPFPRWRCIAPPRRIGLAEDLRRRHPDADLSGIPPEPDILIAGCGTGRHPLQVAARHPHRSVVAFDLSAASLAYAQHRTQCQGLDRLSFHRADIFDLAGWDRRFHLVEAAGVLHHTADPIAAWRVLRDLLHPGGWMKVGLYSETARRDLTRVREGLSAAGYDPMPPGMRRFRHDVLAGRLGDGYRFLRGVTDFYNLDHLRDLLFHAWETRFTVEKIAQALEMLDLRFAGFAFQDASVPARYAARFPEDPLGLALRNWEAFEADNPDTFIEMYTVLCFDAAGAGTE